MSVIVEIIQGHHLPDSRAVGDKQFFSQRAYAHLGGAFPVEISIPLNAPVDAQPIGKYTIADSSFRVGKYNRLEINPYELKLQPVGNVSTQKQG